MEKVYGTYTLALECINTFTNKWRVRWGQSSETKTDSESNMTTNNFFYEEEFVGVKPSLDEIKDIVVAYYNSLCDKEILSGFQYNGNMVWLSAENQFNYKAAFDIAFQLKILGQEYSPVTFKLGDVEAPVYETFNTFTDLQAFVISVFTYINQTLAKFWTIKDAIDWSKYE